MGRTKTKIIAFKKHIYYTYYKSSMLFIINKFLTHRAVAIYQILTIIYKKLIYRH